MRKATICFLLRGDEVLLAMKKRGFGQGKWNGYGGKVQDGESIVGAALRELLEESGVNVDSSALRQVAQLRFFFDNNPDWDQEVHVFFAQDWQGQEAETEEMAPQWFGVNSLPLAEMWQDDEIWLPLVLEGKTVSGEFRFNADGSKMESWDLGETVF